MKYMNARTVKFSLMFLLTLQFMVFGAYAQTLTITGVVKEQATGEPMIGVTVIDIRTNNGTVTDLNGAYSIKAQKGDVVEFSYVGMQTVAIEILDQKELNIEMATASVDVETVMVVAYGTAKKSSFTGSAEVVGEKQLESRPVSNITKALDGNVAGLEATSGGGQPGAGSQIVIRGVGSINASQTPLYVVDGVPYDGSISSLNPDDIAGLTVLKDASAAALYGSRAANGVIVITTKKGKVGRAVINFKGNVGVTSKVKSEYERLNQAQFMEANYDYVRFKYMNDPNSPMMSEDANQQALQEYMNNLGGEKYNPFNIHSTELIDPETGNVVDGAVSRWNDDWMEAAMRDVAIRQEYVVSARGGTEKAQYTLSLGYLNEQGIAYNSDYQRFTARVGVDARLKPWIRTALSANYANGKTNNGASSSGAANVWSSGLMMAPIYPLYERDAEGNQVLDEAGKPKYDYGDTRPNQKGFNSVALLFEDQHYAKNDEIGVRGSVELGDRTNASLGFFRDFTLSVNYGMDYVSSAAHSFNNPFTGNAANSGGRMTKIQDKLMTQTINEMISYNKQWTDHNLSIVLGHEFMDRKTDHLLGARTGFMYSGSSILDQGTVVEKAESSSQLFRLDSYFLNGNYNYKDKYYVSANFRTDGSSRFHESSRWGQFWSVGASWKITGEKFMQSSRRWLNNLTLKASYGVLGNDGVGTYYAWQETYNYGFNNGYYPGVIVNQLENKNLKWEMSNNLNVGIETSMFGGRLGATIEYYNRVTKDMLLYRPMPMSSGHSGVLENVGSMRNQGVEVTINGTPVVTNAFRWQSTLIFSKNANKVLALSEGRDQISMGSQIIKVGAPIYSYYFAEFAGVDPETGDELFFDKDGNKTNQSQLAERRLMGSRTPLFSGGFSNVFTLKGFELSILLNYSVGGKIFDNNYINLMSTTAYGNSWHKDMERRWRKPGDITDVPRLQLDGAMVATDRFLVDASYFKIQNVSLAYTFNFKNMQQKGISALKLFLTGDNLLTVAARKGLDPKQSLTGSTSFSYAPVTTISFGVDLTF